MGKASKELQTLPCTKAHGRGQMMRGVLGDRRAVGGSANEDMYRGQHGDKNDQRLKKQCRTSQTETNPPTSECVHRLGG